MLQPQITRYEAILTRVTSLDPDPDPVPYADKQRSTCRMELLKAGGIEMLLACAGFVAANTAGSVGGISATPAVYVVCAGWYAAGPEGDGA